MAKCGECGKEAKVHLSLSSDETLSLCADCYSAMTAELIDEEMPAVPQTICLEDCEGTQHTFQIEFLFHPHCKELSARENYEDGYVCEVLGKPEENFAFLWSRLTYRLSRVLSVKHIADDGRWNGNKVAGYVNYDTGTDAHYVVIDGKRYEWEELGRQLAAHEGFQIKIEFADPSDDPL